MRPEEHHARGASFTACLEVKIFWGDSALHVEHWSLPRSVYLGAAPAAPNASVIALSMPDATLVTGIPLVLMNDRGVPMLVLPEGAEGWVELAGASRQTVAELSAGPCAALEGSRQVGFPLGSSARVEAFGLVFCVSVSAEDRRPARRSFVDKKQVLFVLGSAVLQLGALAALACTCPPLPADGAATPEQIHQMQLALQSVAEKELEQREVEQVAEASSDAKEGGSGTRAKGEEGSMGGAARGHRYGVQGPDAHVARQAALREAAEFGMIGLLNAGSGGDPNAPAAPWGVDDSLGIGPLSARGSGQGFGVGGAGRRAGEHVGAPPAAAPPVEASIDPNGRFATTYRPGGGHLAAFESAIARGILPPATREVVSDVGARYAPPVDLARGRALGMRVDLERAKLAPEGGPFHLRLALRSAAAAPTERPHLSVHLVLDVSGSMHGESIQRAREAADALVDRLAPTDDFSLTTFSSDAAVRVPDGLVGPRRAEIKSIIQHIGVQGGTNIGDGLSLGYAQASQQSIPDDAVRVVLLLSDGQANEGITSRERLSRLALDAFQRGIQTSALGLGSDYDGALMSSIANDGAGGYYYLKSPDQIAPALATELDKRLDPVATAVEVRVRLKRDVSLLRAYGSRRLTDWEAERVRTAEIAADRQADQRDGIKQNRQDDAEGGMRFFIPAFARDDSHAMLLKLKVPAGVDGRSIGLVELKYKDRIAKTNIVEELPIAVTYGDSDAASGATIDASVARTVQGFAAGEALSEAAARIARGDRASAVALLSEREGILRQAAETLNEPLFLRDAARLARLRGDAEGAGEPLLLAMMLETAGRVHLH